MPNTDFNKVLAVIKKNVPKGYEFVDNGRMSVFQVPLKDYPDTYNKQPLMYVAIAEQKNYNSLYLLPACSHEPTRKKLEQTFKKAGKKLDMGKSCIRFRSADDLELDVIGEIIGSIPMLKWIDIAKSARKK